MQPVLRLQHQANQLCALLAIITNDLAASIPGKFIVS
jgi:hypothetical protein